MGFLGGLAGTLGKIIETQGDEQRKEAMLLRSEDRAAARKFNEADNEMMLDGQLYHVLKGKDGNVISKRPFTDTELKDRGSADLKRAADDTDNRDALNEEETYQEAVAKGFPGTKKQWNKSIEQEADDKTWKNRNEIEFNQSRELANLRGSISASGRAAKDSDEVKYLKGIAKKIIEDKGSFTGLSPAAAARLSGKALEGGLQSQNAIRELIAAGKYVPAVTTGSIDPFAVK